MYRLEWEKLENGNVRLLGVSDMPGEVELPEKIEGMLLTEVGSHCFAQNKYLERVVLPESVIKIDRMAFYNCTSLKEVEMGANLLELGGDAFMNCHNLHLLKVRCGASEKSGVRFVLRQITSDMTVYFLGSDESEEAKVLFSEYYESYDEVTPAHLFGRNIEGEGFRARQCFREGVLEYARYDSTFSKACAEESEKTLCEMAMNRLYYPVALTEDAKKRYQDYVKAHIETICANAVRNREIAVLDFLCANKLMVQSDLDKCVNLAAEYEWAEGGVQILRLKKQYFMPITTKERYTFDDF